MPIKTFDFQIFADYHQFYLEDENSPHDTGDIWNQETVEQMAATAKGLLAVGTARSSTVPVTVEFHDGEPILELEKYSRVNECSLEITSDRLVISGCTDYLPDAERIEVIPSIYRVRILYGNLETVVEEWEGEDFYLLQLWKDSEMREISTLKP